MSEGDDHLGQLMAVYAAERADQASAAAVNAGVVSVALGYVVGALTLLSQIAPGDALAVILCAAPFPVISLNGYISLQVAAGMVRRNLLLRLEQASLQYAPKHPPLFASLYHTMILGKLSWGGGILTFATLVSPLATSFLFTYCVLFELPASSTLGQPLQIGALIAYALLLGLNAYVLWRASRVVEGDGHQLYREAYRRLATLRVPVVTE